MWESGAWACQESGRGNSKCESQESGCVRSLGVRTVSVGVRTPAFNLRVHTICRILIMPLSSPRVLGSTDKAACSNTHLRGFHACDPQGKMQEGLLGMGGSGDDRNVAEQAHQLSRAGRLCAASPS